MGGAENKRKKEEKGARGGLWIFVLGRFDPRVLDRVRREDIRVLRPFFSHFTKTFSLFSPFSLKLSVLSPLFSDEKWWPEVVVGGGGGGAVAGRLRRRRCRCKRFFYFFFVLSLLHLPLYTFPDLTSPNTNYMSLDLNGKKKEKVILLCFFVLLFLCCDLGHYWLICG